MFLVACCSLVVVCRSLFGVGCLLFVLFGVLFIVRRVSSLCVVIHGVVLFRVCWLLIVVRIALFVFVVSVYFLFLFLVCVVCWLSFDGSWLLFVVRCALFGDRGLGVHCPFFVVGCCFLVVCCWLLFVG